jgi:hypothetical protein
MDVLIEQKVSIYNELARKKNEGILSQNDAVDLKQELERCNFIMNHIIRGYTNPAGRYAAMAVFGSAGFAFWLTTRPLKAGLFSIKSAFTLPIFVGIPMLLGSAFAKRRLGDKREATRFSQMRDESYDIDEKFYEILDNLKKQDLKY